MDPLLAFLVGLVAIAAAGRSAQPAKARPARKRKPRSTRPAARPKPAPRSTGRAVAPPKPAAPRQPAPLPPPRPEPAAAGRPRKQAVDLDELARRIEAGEIRGEALAELFRQGVVRVK